MKIKAVIVLLLFISFGFVWGSMVISELYCLGDLDGIIFIYIGGFLTSVRVNMSYRKNYFVLL